MHIILHTQYYPPEIGAPQARLSELAEGLANNGFEVTVLTAMPSYPLGKIFPGYGGFLRLEKKGKIRIIRTFIFPTQSPRFLPRLLNYFSFVFSSLMGGLIHLHNVDILLTESPPLFLGITGFLLSRIKRARWIFNVSDLWPESAIRLGVVSDGWALRLSQALEGFCYRKSWLITAQSRTILEYIKSRYSDASIYHLSNGVNTELFFPGPGDILQRQIYAAHGELIILYAGLHGIAQGLDQILCTAQHIQNEEIKTIRFVLVGDGPQKRTLIELARKWNLENVTFFDSIQKEIIPSIISIADVWIVPLKTYLPGAVPSKLYEGMASGKPVILIAEGEAAEIVNMAKCGLVVQPGNADELYDAIIKISTDAALRKQLGEAGRKAVLRDYDRSKIIYKFVEYLNHLGNSESNKVL